MLAALLVLPTALRGDTDWTPLFKGRIFGRWKPSKHGGSFRVADGQIAADGPRLRLFCTGSVRNADFKSFATSTRRGSNGWSWSEPSRCRFGWITGGRNGRHIQFALKFIF